MKDSFLRLAGSRSLCAGAGVFSNGLHAGGECQEFYKIPGTF